MDHRDDIIEFKRWMASRDEKMNKMDKRQTVLEVTQEHIVKSLDNIHTNTRHLVWVGVSTLVSMIGTLLWLIASGKLTIT